MIALLAPLGTDHLTEVAELRFTFHMEERGEAPIARTWAWRPGEGSVTRTVDGVAITWKASVPTDEAQREADAQFVHDSFWLAPHMHLRWAPELVVVDEGMRPLPVGEGTARKVVARYPASEGGYTPGDTFDLYLDGLGRLLAWNYRRKGAEPPLTATFSGYRQTGPLELATERVSADGAMRIWFTEVGVTLAPGIVSVAPLTEDKREGKAVVEILDPVRCRLRSVALPLGSVVASLPSEGNEPRNESHKQPRKASFDASFVVRRGDRVEVARYSSSTLALEEPGWAHTVGFRRCDLRGLGTDTIGQLLAGATREERSVLLALGLEAWLPRPSLLQEPVRLLAIRCAQTGDCGAFVELAQRR